MLKISGLDKLQRQLEDAQRAFKALDGQLASVRFDPDKPESIEPSAPWNPPSMTRSLLIEIRRWSPALSLNSRKSTAPQFWSEQRRGERRFYSGLRSVFSKGSLLSSDLRRAQSRFSVPERGA